jgi:4-amino-4-deoxy-L-arabinose transferase-like glycosyltransferase
MNIKKNMAKHNLLILSLVIFIFAFSLRIWNLNKAGQMWDEKSLIADYAWQHVADARNLNFGSDYWWKGVQDHPPLVKYLRAVASIPDIKGWNSKGFPIYNYDLTYDRMLSVFLSSLAAVLVFFIGARYISLYSGVVAGMIFSMLPIPLGHSQIALYEPFGLFFFTASMFAFFLFLEKPTKKRMTLSGIALGFALLSRETHIMLVPMMLIILYIKNFNNNVKFPVPVFLKILGSFGIAFLTFFLVWPMPFFHLGWEFNYFMYLRVYASKGIPEVFFGHLMLTKFPYYFVYSLVTTPFLILLLALIGAKKIDKSKNWTWYSIVFWFCFPFIMSFYSEKQQGIRYIIQITIPLALIAAIGFETLVSKFVKKINYKIILLIPLFLYQFIILLRITPYYIDYFNVLVGGAKNVYEKRLFQLGWWGEGIKESFDYLNKYAPVGATVGIATSPSHISPPLPGRKVVSYKDGGNYDFVVVNFYNVLREGFDDSKIINNYKNVYSVVADGAHLVEVYKRK